MRVAFPLVGGSVMSLRHDEVLYEGDSIPVRRVGGVVHRDDGFERVEAVEWDFHEVDGVRLTLVVGSRPYTF
jgi:hypothetical protein